MIAAPLYMPITNDATGTVNRQVGNRHKCHFGGRALIDGGDFVQVCIIPVRVACHSLTYEQALSEGHGGLGTKIIFIVDVLISNHTSIVVHYLIHGAHASIDNVVLRWSDQGSFDIVCICIQYQMKPRAP